VGAEIDSAEVIRRVYARRLAKKGEGRIPPRPDLMEQLEADLVFRPSAELPRGDFSVSGE
jgi:hypothetical protein